MLEHAEWDFAAIYYDGIDHFSHGFMNFHPPKPPWVKEEDFAIYQHVIANAYRYHDAMLGRLLQLAGPDVTVIVLSDHGFHPDMQRPGYIPAEVAGPSVEHRHFGMFTIHGPGIKPGETLYGSTVLDVTPTILHLFGLPVGRDMDGKVLATAFEEAREIKIIDTWDAVAGDAGTHPPGAQLDSVASAEAMKQLVALGYVAPPGGDSSKAVADTIAELKYNLARAHSDAGEWDDAARLFEELHAGDPGDQRYIDHAISALIVTGQRARARQMLDDFDTRVETTAPEAEAELKRRREEKPDEELNSLTGMKDQRESFERRNLAERSSGFTMLRLMLRLRIDVADERFDDARRGLEALEALCANATAVPAMLFARAYTQLKDDDRALAWIGKALERDPENWEALAFAARIHLRNRRFAAAGDAALLSLSLIYFQPLTHYVLGRSLMARKDDSNAEQAFKTALNQMPGLVPAHNALARLYERQHKYNHATMHRRKASELLEVRKAHSRSKSKPAQAPAAALTPLAERPGTVPADPARDVIIVAGLPRSGTSMLMQLLAAGGIEPLTDGLRTADMDNPRGYFEFEPATRLGRDVSWLPQARGKAVKLALPLVTRLPAGESYRIIIIERDPGEVIASQRVMLERLGRTGAALDDNALAAEYRRQRERVVHWLARRAEVAVLPLRYDAILSDPHSAAARIASFLGTPFDVDAAAEAVDPLLRRQTAAS